MIINYIAGILVEYLKLILAMCGVFNFKIKKSFVPIIILIVSAAALTAFKELQVYVPYSGAVALMMCFASTKGKNKILLSLLSFLSICCIDEINTALIVLVSDISYNDMVNDPDNALITNSVCIIMLSFITFLRKNIIGSKKHDNCFRKTGKIYLYLFIAGQISVLLYISLYNMLNLKYSSIEEVTIILSACIAIILLMIVEVLLVYNINSKRYYKQLSAVNQKLLNSKENYYKMLLSQENETRKFRHDIANHILCLNTLLNEQKYSQAEEYLSHMNSSVCALKRKCDTGNILISAIINDTASKYKDVILNWNGGMPENMTISDVDVCTIFSNILDNAFEAASHSELKHVDVTIKTISNNLVVIVENDISTDVVVADGKFITTKQDRKNHGIGTQNVNACVSANGGSAEFKFDDKKFTVEIVLPNALDVM